MTIIIIVFKCSFIWDCEICCIPFTDNSKNTCEEQAGRAEGKEENVEKYS